MNIKLHIDNFRKKFAEIEEQLSAPNLYDNPRKAQELTREHSRLKSALADADALAQLEKDLEENRAIVQSGEDKDLAELATEEIPSLEKRVAELRQRVLAAIVPPDPNDSRNTIIEIRAGTGGDEAAIFAADLFRMYSRYAERAGWKIEVMDSSPSELGGLKEIIFNLSGTEVFKKMRFESGVHRVQRVPVTESQGRIHTSTATVAVLPEAEEVDMAIRPDELKIEVCRASGPGGQGVNTTDSAVQIMHIPTGLIVRCQEGRSQIKNKEKAMSVLRARLYEKKKSEEEQKYAAHRRQQIGAGERNEKIRTYNYPQNRITDHRVNHTMYNLSLYMDGDIEEMIEKMLAADLAEKLQEFNSNS
ncbi:MAG: peptide chain release factor 1 [Verrucomicrobiota bacterium]